MVKKSMKPVEVENVEIPNAVMKVPKDRQIFSYDMKAMVYLGEMGGDAICGVEKGGDYTDWKKLCGDTGTLVTASSGRCSLSSGRYRRFLLVESNSTPRCRDRSRSRALSPRLYTHIASGSPRGRATYAVRYRHRRVRTAVHRVVASARAPRGDM